MTDSRSPFFDGSFRATDQSLDIAAEIAKLVGQPFDPEDTRQFVGRLHRTYYESIIATLGLDGEKIGFASGSAKHVAAFVPRLGTTVHLDEHLDFWTFTLTHLLTVAACKPLPDDERAKLLALYQFAANPILFPSRHPQARDQLLPWMRAHPDCLQLSHALSRAMTVFVICHEIAHAVLGHPHQEAAESHEFQADALAVDYFRRIQQAGTRVDWIYVHEKMLVAPLLLLRLVALAERLLQQEASETPPHRSHPNAVERARRVEELLGPAITDGARYILNGFSAALDDILLDFRIEKH